MNILRKLAFLLLVIMAGFSVVSRAQAQREKADGQQDKDSLVVLLSSKSARSKPQWLWLCSTYIWPWSSRLDISPLAKFYYHVIK